MQLPRKRNVPHERELPGKERYILRENNIQPAELRHQGIHRSQRTNMEKKGSETTRGISRTGGTKTRQRYPRRSGRSKTQEGPSVLTGASSAMHLLSIRVQGNAICP